MRHLTDIVQANEQAVVDHERRLQNLENSPEFRGAPGIGPDRLTPRYRPQTRYTVALDGAYTFQVAQGGPFLSSAIETDLFPDLPATPAEAFRVAAQVLAWPGTRGLKIRLLRVHRSATGAITSEEY